MNTYALYNGDKRELSFTAEDSREAEEKTLGYCRYTGLSYGRQVISQQTDENYDLNNDLINAYYAKKKKEDDKRNKKMWVKDIFIID